MFAARILFLARTSRWAIVGSVTSRARAISGVCSPAISRSVSATCASMLRAGWQQVKISRRRSSSTGPTSCGSSVVCSSRACALAIVTRRLAPQTIDRSVLGRGDDPAGRAGRQSGLRPTLHGDGERLLDRLLGDVDVTEEADQAGHCSTGLGAEDALDVCCMDCSDHRARVSSRARLGRGGPRPALRTPRWLGEPRRGPHRDRRR